MHPGRKQKGCEFWSVKAIAKRHRLKAESRLPESKALPPPPIAKRRGIVTRLAEGETCAVIGWQAAPQAAPKWLTEGIARNVAKRVKLARYERQFKRRAPQEEV